jgi:hypothetical protein
MPSKEKHAGLQKFTSTPYARSLTPTKIQKSTILAIRLCQKEEKEGLVDLKIKNQFNREIPPNQALIQRRNKLFRTQIQKKSKMA